MGNVYDLYVNSVDLAASGWPPDCLTWCELSGADDGPFPANVLSDCTWNTVWLSPILIHARKGRPTSPSVEYCGLLFERSGHTGFSYET